MKLERLKHVDLREVWTDEAREFTPWLARPENIGLLSEAIGLDLELEETEVAVGAYKADIVAADSDGRRVVIENQLERTNHDHLGKIVTYAAGVDADVVIWISSDISDEHRRAMEWLNETSTGSVAFFALEIELWQIGESPPAPKFNIVSSPNEWSSAVRKEVELSETKKIHLEFWTEFNRHMRERETPLGLRTPRPQHWYSLAVGRSKFSISLTSNTQLRRVGCELYIRGERAKEAFAKLQEDKEAIEQDLGARLEWYERPDGQDCRIVQFREGDPKDKAQWPDLHTWLGERAEAFHQAFTERVKAMPLD